MDLVWASCHVVRQWISRLFVCALFEVPRRKVVSKNLSFCFSRLSFLGKNLRYLGYRAEFICVLDLSFLKILYAICTYKKIKFLHSYQMSKLQNLFVPKIHLEYPVPTYKHNCIFESPKLSLK